MPCQGNAGSASLNAKTPTTMQRGRQIYKEDQHIGRKVASEIRRGLSGASANHSIVLREGLPLEASGLTTINDGPTTSNNTPKACALAFAQLKRV